MYLPPALAGTVLDRLAQAMAPGGYLFLGHAESLSRITDLFTPIRFQGAMVYQKPLPAAEGR